MRSPWTMCACFLLVACGGGSGGTTSGGGGGGGCAVLGATGVLTLVSGQKVQVSLEVRFVSLTDMFMQGAGIDFKDVDGVTTVTDPGFGGEFVERPTFCTQAGVVGFSEPADTVIPSGHHPGSYLPNAFFGAGPGQDLIATFVQAPGADDQCLDVDPLLREPVVGSQPIPPVTPIIPVGDLPAGQGMASVILDAMQTQALLDAAALDANQKVMSHPAIELFDGQRTAALAQTEEGMATDFLDVVQNTVLDGASVDVVRTGVTLDVRPTVGLSDMITLDIRPTSHLAVATLTGTFLVAGNPTEIQVPVLVPTTVHTTYTVQDGHTLFLGGLKMLSDDGKTGIPLVSRIPYVNRLFKGGTSLSLGADLMIMVTPRIIH